MTPASHKSRSAKGEEVLLTTLIDLLLQIIFVFVFLSQVFFSQRSTTPDDSVALRKVFDLSGVPSIEAFIEKWSHLIDVKALEDRYKKMLAELHEHDSLAAELEKAKADLKNAQEQADLYKEDSVELARIRDAARGFRPCLAPLGQTISLMTIKITEDGLMIYKGPTPEAQIALARYPELLPFLDTGTPIPLGDFERKFGIFRKREATCRHYVSVRDQSISKEMFKSAERSIEGLFYLQSSR